MKKIILLTVTILGLVLSGCKKDELPQTTVCSVSDEKVVAAANSVSISGSYISTGTVSDMNIIYGLTENLESSSSESCTINNQKFSVEITGLSNGTEYYYCFEFRNEYSSVKSEVKSFKIESTSPSVTTSSVSNITQTTATCGGNVTSDGGATVTARGVCWSTNQNPTISDSHTTDDDGTGSFTSSITGLTANMTYYVRAYATNSKGTSYGEQKSFTTLQSGTVTVPSVTTNSVSNISQTTATCGGNVTSDGGATVTAKGVCWSTSPNPTISNSHTTDGNGTGSFTSSITGLSANKTYYVRAYATNSKGTSYGEQKNFTTQQSGTVTVPSVITNSVSNIAQTTATCGGNVTSDGGATVTAKGVCWSTSQNPTISNSHTTNGSGTGSFTSSITGLTANKTYYVRAYATNSKGTGYGTQKSFTTLQGGDASTPTVTTSSVSNITQTSATCGGNVTSDGGATVTVRGVCWSTSSNPTTNNSHTTNGCGTGSFTSSITGLTANKTYYVRAYAINSAGTSYGDQKSFTTYSGGGGTHAYVELGLPSGLLWATCNIGATNPEDYGDYFAWGETSPKSNYSWSTYQWCNGSYNTLTKYCTQSSYGYNGFVDNKTVLEPADDAAHVNWGGDWRMPTTQEWQELYDNTTSTWIIQGGVYGRRFTSTVVGYTGASLFIPAAGHRTGTSLYGTGSEGNYWLSSLGTHDPYYAGRIFFDSDDVEWEAVDYRFCGFPVRPVCQP